MQNMQIRNSGNHMAVPASTSSKYPQPTCKSVSVRTEYWKLTHDSELNRLKGFIMASIISLGQTAKVLFGEADYE